MISAAITAPAHSAGRRSRSRGPTTSTASASTEQSSSTWNFVSAAIPTTTPSTSSSRSSRRFVQRASSQAISSHCTGSSAYGVSQCPENAIHTAVAWAPAVISWARRSPPNSRASNAATTTAAAVARIAGTRSATIEPGATASAAAASNGATGG